MAETKQTIWLATLSSVQFLSRLPIHKLIQLDETPDFKTSSHTYGLAGLLIALPAALVLALALFAGLSPLVSAVLCITTNIIITGALHEDGLADVTDGFWGGHTKERKLEIMRDSAIGTYGVLGLVISVALRVALLSMLINAMGMIACIMVVAVGSLSRFAMLWPWSTLPQARIDTPNTKKAAKEAQSLAAKYGAPDSTEFNRAILFVIPALVLIAVTLPPLTTICAIVIAVLFVLALSALSSRHIGGHTGDTLGATQQICEIGLYLGASIAI